MSDSENIGGVERIRRAASFTAVTIFGASFLALLVLSATPYWRPENRFLSLCDQVWRVSGVAALVLGTIPQLRKLYVSVSGWLVPDGN